MTRHSIIVIFAVLLLLLGACTIQKGNEATPTAHHFQKITPEDFTHLPGFALPITTTENPIQMEPNKNKILGVAYYYNPHINSPNEYQLDVRECGTQNPTINVSIHHREDHNENIMLFTTVVTTENIGTFYCRLCFVEGEKEETFGCKDVSFVVI